MKIQEYRQYLKQKASERKSANKKVKNATPTQTDGRSFASKLEAAVYQMIKFREMAGELELLQCQDHVRLTDAEILYIPDFKCLNLKTGEVMWIEAKGFANDVWPLKKRLWKTYGPGVLEIWGGYYTRPTLLEIITPRGPSVKIQTVDPRQTDLTDFIKPSKDQP